MIDYSILTQKICEKASDFGFLDAKIASIKIDLVSQSNFNNWLSRKLYGEMTYLERNKALRFNPQLLHNNTLSIICVKCSYLTTPIKYHQLRLEKEDLAYISSYALGRDYHKTIKQQLKNYASWIENEITYLEGHHDKLNYRVFTDSAPIMEVELATNAGLGFRGKNTLLLNTKEGSMFFLGEIFTNLPLIPHEPVSSHCGRCTKCLEICPTKAFIAPYVLDATKCISYLTIEHKGTIPEELRKAIGNRVYGCDDCQLVCPWNKFSKISTLSDFKTRHDLHKLSLVDAFLMDKPKWEDIMSGSAIYRIGYNQWLRNVAIALGNAKTSQKIVDALKSKILYHDPLVREHVKWAIAQHIK